MPNTAASEPAWIVDVLSFWFVETPPEAWFKRDEAFDATIRRRFADLIGKVAALPPDVATQTARQALAATIVLDQFPRNIHRDSARAFACDAAARAIATEAIGKGFDCGLGMYERLFLYLPLEHSESLQDQERSVTLISALGDPELTRYAIAHRDIVARFGRFPHRNAALGRQSTPGETAFLQQPGSSF